MRSQVGWGPGDTGQTGSRWAPRRGRRRPDRGRTTTFRFAAVSRHRRRDHSAALTRPLNRSWCPLTCPFPSPFPPQRTRALLVPAPSAPRGQHLIHSSIPFPFPSFRIARAPLVPTVRSHSTGNAPPSARRRRPPLPRSPRRRRRSRVVDLRARRAGAGSLAPRGGARARDRRLADHATPRRRAEHADPVGQLRRRARRRLR